MPQSNKDPIRDSVESVKSDRVRQIEGAREGRPSLFTCPECGGVLWQVKEPELVQFRCHVGHIVSGEHLLVEQGNAAEDALWTAIRTLEDRSVLGRQLSRFAAKLNDTASAARYGRQAERAEKRFRTLLKIAETGDEEEAVDSTGSA
jgi:two-component system chemotaxis response regulator CheB